MQVLGFRLSSNPHPFLTQMGRRVCTLVEACDENNLFTIANNLILYNGNIVT